VVPSDRIFRLGAARLARQDPYDALDDEEAAAPSRPGLPVDLYRLRRAVLRGKWWILAAAVIGSAVGFAIGKFVVKQKYEASASIQYAGLPGQPPHVVQRDLPGLVAAVHTEQVLFAWRDRVGDLDDANLTALRAMVSVSSDPGSGLVTFTTWAEEPERTSEMANTAVDVFLEHHRERRRAELQDEIASLRERIEAVHTELTTARQTYDTFRRANGITDLTAEQEAAIEQAADLRSQADMGHAEVESLEARVAQLRSELENTPRTETHSSGASQEQRRLRQLQQLLAEARGQGLGEEHPRVQALRRQVEALEGSAGGSGGASRTNTNPVYTQLQTSLQTAQTELEAARQRVTSLEQLAVQAQERTARFSEIEGQAANLLAQVNVKQELLNELNEQRSSIDDALRDIETGFRPVSSARPPDTALPSKKKYAVAAGLPIAFVAIMIAMLLFRELRGLKVQTAREVAYWGNGPVIGTTKWPRDPTALADLVADLDDYAPDARGTMLVVGSTTQEGALAAEIASQLNQDWTSSTMMNMAPIASLPPNAATPRSDPPPASPGYYDDDEVISGEIHDGPTEISFVSPATDLDLIDAPTEVEHPHPVPDASERMVCTAWTEKPEGQALRRAARLADRVLVVVTSGGVKASELATVRTRLGIDDGIGYVLVGASDDLSRLPDREGPVETFWQATAAR